MDVIPSPKPVENCAENNLNLSEVSEAAENKKRRRGQWLRAAILGANDGLLSTTSLMIGFGAAAGKDDDDDGRQHDMILAGLAGALAGACSMAVGEFVSVSTQRDIESVEDQETQHKNDVENGGIIRIESMANPYKAAVASCLSFLCGSLVPLLTSVAAPNNIRIVAIVVLASVALAVFGGAGAYFGGSPVRKSAGRVLIGGWISMAITYGMLKSFSTNSKGHDTN